MLPEARASIYLCSCYAFVCVKTVRTNTCKAHRKNPLNAISSSS